LKGFTAIAFALVGFIVLAIIFNSRGDEVSAGTTEGADLAEDLVDTSTSDAT
jgi:hypothetical protein